MPHSHRTRLLSRGRTLPRLEELEDRRLLSANLLMHPSGLTILPASSPGVAIYNPSQMRMAYGLTAVANQGQGMTVAIVDAFNDPNITSDLSIFSSQFGLPQMNGVGGNPTFQILVPPGQSTPPNAPHNDWALEISLDVEWVHAIAPKANIDLIETQDNSGDHLFAAEVDGQPYMSGVGYAQTLPGVVVVSNSYGGGEFNGETDYDAEFAASHVAFTFSTGDSGAPGEYPAYSPNVVAVGGTSLNTISVRGAYGTEAGWAGSGGGVSQFEPTPAFQSNNGVNFGARATPDISMDADPNTGVLIIDQYDFPGQFVGIGGTSLAAPMWAGLIAIGDQGRIAGGGQALNSQGVLNALYGTYNSANYLSTFHDIKTGSNGFAAGVGFDLNTGIGSPKAQAVIPLLVSAADGPAPAAVVSTPGGLGGQGSASVGGGTIAVANPALAALANHTATSQFAAVTTASSQSQTAAIVGLSTASPVARADAGADVATPAAHTGAALEGFRGTIDVTPAGTDVVGTPVEFGLPVAPVDAATSAAVPAAANAVLPATLAGAVSDAVFADFHAADAGHAAAAPVVVAGDSEAHSANLALFAGLALVLSGSWTAAAQAEETRKYPALRN